jgi:hypothetical protein
MTIDLDKLRVPFSPEKIHWRVGATTKDKARGLALAYIDARDVMERLDAVCGPENWQRRYVDAGTGRTCCEIGINVHGGLAIHSENDPPEFLERWIWKGDGAGDTDVEGEKGAFSDAFKRAAVNWGIGRYLYDVKSPWVELEKQGNTHVIKESEMGKLRQCLLADAPPPARSKPAKQTAPAKTEDSGKVTFEMAKAAILNAPNLDQLKHVWTANYDMVGAECTDKQQADLIALKDKRKAALSEEKAA